MPLAEAHAARISFRHGSWGVPRTALARPSVFGGGAISLRRDSGGKKRHSLVHSSGKSPEKYLPETTGAGCAFFHYDNDGWMDIYLVNSGKCDFAGRAAAQRTVQRQPGWDL
jgi:hypothetical protein